jgi:hypothetical protein
MVELDATQQIDNNDDNTTNNDSAINKNSNPARDMHCGGISLSSLPLSLRSAYVWAGGRAGMCGCLCGCDACSVVST